MGEGPVLAMKRCGHGDLEERLNYSFGFAEGPSSACESVARSPDALDFSRSDSAELVRHGQDVVNGGGKATINLDCRTYCLCR